MILAEVIGRVWCDRQLAGLSARRLVTVRDISDRTTLVAVDMLDVGLGTTVLVTTERGCCGSLRRSHCRRDDRGARLGLRPDTGEVGTTICNNMPSEP